MKKIISITTIFYTAILFGQSNSNVTCDNFIYFEKSDEELRKYIDNPCPNDSTCLSEIGKAKSEIQKGKITFCMPMSMETYELRQEKQLRQLCKEKGIDFDYELFGCIVNSGQTYGCYGIYMDKIIVEKFGKDFKSNLLKKADSLLVLSKSIIYYTNCDSLPHLPEKDVRESTDFDVPLRKEILDKIKISMYGYYPQVDIGFYVDTLGVPSGYFISQYIVYDDIKENEKFRKELCSAAMGFIKKFKTWIPGKILNQIVRTELNTRISFVEAK